MKELETWTGTILLCRLDFLSRLVHVEYLNRPALVSSVQRIVADDGITTSSKLVQIHTCCHQHDVDDGMVPARVRLQLSRNVVALMVQAGVCEAQESEMEHTYSPGAFICCVSHRCGYSCR